ncbi:hypothetical protein SNR37_001208 [Agarivorans aestuarii]|uniref:Uncharacterized protein n=1 Tax=Agarivorans aestuarii TaxID=1563703 RepID=A0ABU7G9E8_9ALTE|nr:MULTISPECIES: hypothetical protein [Agarivorans]MEE1675881.1 hypothetical protein [Agarivorans aestuarii]
MSSNQKCPACGGHKPALMACRDCGFTYSVTSRPPAATKPVPQAKPVPRSEYRAVVEEGGAKAKVVIKTKKRRTYTIPSEE